MEVNGVRGATRRHKGASRVSQIKPNIDKCHCFYFCTLPLVLQSSGATLFSTVLAGIGTWNLEKRTSLFGNHCVERKPLNGRNEIVFGNRLAGG
jgi:hypothetical protein